MSEPFAYVFAALLLCGFAWTSWLIFKSLKAGEIDANVWGGANNADNHYGFVFRIGGLIILLGVIGFMVTQLPDIFQLVKSE